MKKSYVLPIFSIEKLTESSVKLTFEVPESEKLAFSFFSGQYISLETEISGEIVRRAYSICSEPDQKYLSVAIKEIPNGKFSSFAQELQAGDELRVFPPEGKFAYIWEIYPENLALFATGSGITPILSIIKVALKQTNNKILLVYGNKAPQSTMFLEEIQDLSEKYPERFFVEYIFSQSYEKNKFFGRMDATIIQHLLKNKYKETNFGRFYICGQQAMVQIVREELEKNYEAKKIHTELFITEKKIEKTYEGETIFTIRANGQTSTFSAMRAVPILETLLTKGIDISYSCRGGVCSSCLAKITEGSAEMVKNQILSETEITNGLLLTCQAHATSERLNLDFDAV